MILTLNGYFGQGTNAERLAYTPDPTMPAVGPKPNVMWQETDTGDLFYWDFDTAAWISTNPGGSVTTVSVASANGFAGSVANPTTTPAITVSTSVTGILKGNGTAVAAAVAGDFPTLNQNTTGSAATATSATTATTATALATGRTIAITGDLAYTSPAFDGTGNVTAAGTLANTAVTPGAYTSADITVDAKGRITAAANGSAGGGTVNTGAALRLAYYPGAGTTVDDMDGAAQGIIGTQSAAPMTGVFGIYGSGQVASSFGARSSSANTQAPYLYFSKSRGSIASPDQTVANDELGALTFGGYTNSSAWNEYAAIINVVAVDSFAAGVTGTKIKFSPCRIGSTTLDDVLVVHGDGYLTSGFTNNQVRFGGKASSTQPSSVIAVFGAGQIESSIAMRCASGNTQAPVLYFAKGRGSMATPSQTLSGDTLGYLFFGGYTNSSTWNEYAASIDVVATENFTSGAVGNKMQFYTCPNGSTTYALALLLNQDKTVRMPAYGAGTATFDASGNISSVSDSRVKTNVRSFSRGLADILQLNPIMHGYTPESGLDQTKGDYTGFLAQEVQGVIPEAIGMNADGMLSFADRPVIAALVNAVKELNEKLARR